MFQGCPSYIQTAANGHVGVARGNLFGRAGAGQVVVVAAAGIVARDEGEGVQRQVLVEQTAERETHIKASKRLLLPPGSSQGSV